MKIHPAAQGSTEWAQARAGIPTTSEFDSLVTPKFKIRDSAMSETYLAKKLAEAWLGGPLLSFNTLDMDFGKILEDEAKPWYSLEFEVDIQSVGLVTTDDGKIGCSPDGLIGDDSGIEIKCPEAHTHVKYLLAGEVPEEYLAQVHGALYVTGRSSWRFLSYRRGFPKLVVQVNRDEKIIAVLDDALGLFLQKFEVGYQRLVDINGGPPRRYKPVVEQPVNAVGDDFRV